jgi:amino-acid N-acetyltransferase
VGTVAVELLGGEGAIAHLRSLAVRQDVRGERLGALLTARAVRLALDRGARSVHAVTETAPGFFERMGFERTGSRDSLPAEILATPMVSDACSENSVALRWPPGARAPGGAPSAAR